jgi:hypothetical protein
MSAFEVDLIGLSGYAGAGKDEVAKILAPRGWRRASFADPLRAALYALNPRIHGTPLRFLVDVLGWDSVKRDHPEARELLQRMGTEVGRNLFGQDFWVEQALAAIEREDGTQYVFTDCRFPNEAEAVRARGGRVWRIERPGVVAVNAHPSETSLDDYRFDAVIANDGTLEALAGKVMAALSDGEWPDLH